MRINALNIRAYGPFTNKRLDLTAGRGKLELLYGPNEAGKSSLLRTLSDFLFGIPVQTHDDFVHRKDSLLIGGTLEHDGKSLSVLRRKGKGNTLLGLDEKTPVPEADFRAVMPIDDAKIFEVMFGINAGRLAEGGKELMSGKGDFGRLLFSAASGIEDFRGILAKLTLDADELFRSRSGLLTRRIDECKDLKSQVSKALLTTGELEDLTAGLAQATAKLKQLDAQLLEKDVEKSRLNRMREALELLGEKQLNLAGLQKLSEVRAPRHGFAEEFARTEEALRQKQSEHQRMVQQLAAVEQEIALLTYSEPLLLQSTAIAALHERIGAERKAAADRVKVYAKVRDAEAKAATIFAELGIPANMETIPTLHVTAENQRKATELDRRFSTLDANRKNTLRDIEARRRDLEDSRRQLEALPQPIPFASLQHVLKSTDSIAADAPNHHARRVRLEAEEKKLADNLRALPWPDSADALASANLPPVSLVEEWRHRFAQSGSKIEAARVKADEAMEQVRQCQSALQQQQAGGAITTQADMDAARAHRDLGWRAVRSAWLEGRVDSAATIEFLHEVAEPSRLADAYQASVAAADQAADNFREHSKEALRLLQAQSDLAAATQKQEAATAALENLHREFVALQAQWAELWAGWKLEPRPPAQMSQWLEGRARLLEDAARHSTERQSLAGHAAQAEASAATLKDSLRAIGVDVEEASLAALRIVAANWIENQQSLHVNRLRLETAASDAARHLQNAENLTREAADELKDWAAQWQALLAQLGLNTELEPAAVRATIDLRRQLTEIYKEWSESQRRIASMDHDTRDFAAHAAKLATEAATEYSSLPALDAAARLYQQLQEHSRNRDLRNEKEKSRSKLKLDCEYAASTLDEIALRLKFLVAETGCIDPSQVPEYIRQSNIRRDIEEDLARIESRLSQLAGIGGIEALEQEALRHTLDELPAESAAITRAIEQLGVERDETLRAETTLRNKLESLDGRNDAARAASDLEAVRANLQEETSRYVRLKLAGHVLKSAVESYRKKASGEMLRRSSEVFRQLTLGGFEELDLDWDDKNNPELVGVRSGGKQRIKTDQMSSGTCDQLYLSLRIASLEVYFQNHPPIPFIADDILIHFDDDRAAAALKVLASLATQTQVLLFTHHGHLRDVAAAALSPQELAVYTI